MKNIFVPSQNSRPLNEIRSHLMLRRLKVSSTSKPSVKRFSILFFKVIMLLPFASLLREGENDLSGSMFKKENYNFLDLLNK